MALSGRLGEEFLRRFMTPGQVRVDGRSNGITAMPALPGIEGSVVTVDAMRTIRATAEAVTTGWHLCLGAQGQPGDVSR